MAMYSGLPRTCRHASIPIATTTLPPTRSPVGEKHMIVLWWIAAPIQPSTKYRVIPRMLSRSWLNLRGGAVGAFFSDQSVRTEKTWTRFTPHSRATSILDFAYNSSSCPAKGKGARQLDERLKSVDCSTHESFRDQHVRARQNLGSANPGLANLGGRNYGSGSHVDRG